MSFRLPRFEEIAAAALGGFVAYVFVLDAPYTLLQETERQIAGLSLQIEAVIPGLDIDPDTATWEYTAPPIGTEARLVREHET